MEWVLIKVLGEKTYSIVLKYFVLSGLTEYRTFKIMGAFKLYKNTATKLDLLENMYLFTTLILYHFK